MRYLFVKLVSRPLRGLLALVAALVFATTAPQAQAQSFFETLFGSPKPPSPPPGGFAPARLLAPGPPSRFHYDPYAPLRAPRDDDDDSQRSNGGARVRTVCVRLCDGYYWPVSYATTRDRINRDANACKASCGEEARLFTMPVSNGQIEQATDLTGRVYAKLPNAFRYRKALVDGCACRPAPWSDAEQQRHDSYASADSRTPKADAAREDGWNVVRVYNPAGDELYGPPVPPDLAEIETAREAMAARLRPERASISEGETRQRPVHRAIARTPTFERRQTQPPRKPSGGPGLWGSPQQPGLIWPGDRPR